MNETIHELLDRYEGVIFGQRENLELLLTAVLSGGHVLLEGVPGTGKTKMVRVLAQLIGGEFRRVQFTPDLLPSDITGSSIFNMKEGQFETLKGPIFTNVLLGDEINRTPAKTQAALLEAMEEKQVTIHGETYPLPEVFFVVATQNPIEFEGTYPLPEAQQDRFLFKLIVDYPNADAEKQAIQHAVVPQPINPSNDSFATLPSFETLREAVQEVNVDGTIMDYILQIVRKSRDSDSIRLGASTRAAIAMAQSAKAWAFLRGRDYVIPDDIKKVVIPALRHRIILSPHVELEGGSSDQIIQDLVGSIPVPR